MDKKVHNFKKRALLALFLLFAYQGYAANADLNVKVFSSSGGALPNGSDGLPAQYNVIKNGSFLKTLTAGSTTNLGSGTYTIYAIYDGTSTSRANFVIPTGNVNVADKNYEFKTTEVKFNFSGNYLNFGTSVDWRSFEKKNGAWVKELFPKDLIGDPIKIQAANVLGDMREVIFPINYDGLTSIEKTISVIQVLNSSNQPIQGATARGMLPYVYFVSGSTNANGLLVDLQEGKKTSNSYEAEFNVTTSTSGLQDPTLNSYYLFNTALVTLKLETCTGDPLSGGKARYTVGPYIYFYPGGDTDGDGETSADLFPGTYSFEMSYENTTETKTPVTIGSGNTTLTWKTTNVTLNWPYDIAYGGTGDLDYFDKPSMELLPGTYNFNFRAPDSYNYTELTIAGCSMNLTLGIIKLRNSNNLPLSGGVVTAYQGGWTNYGTSGVDGNLFVFGKNPSAVRMTYAAGVETKNSNFSLNPIVTFQTTPVTIHFENSSGDGLTSTPADGLASTENMLYYSGIGWNLFGNGETNSSGLATTELLPGSYSFRLWYEGAPQTTAAINIVTTPVVYFKTVKAQVKLVDGINAPLGGGIATYYAYGWRSFGTTDGTTGIAEKELLPVPYSFRMLYSAKTKQLDGVNPGIVSPVLFTFANGNLSRIANPDASTNAAEEFTISIYPNPAVSSINVSLPEGAGTAEVKIITLDGRLVLNKVLEMNNRSVNVSELSAGIYQVGITVDGKSQIHRLVIAR